jgi:uracil-DNA glycosylase
LTLHIDDTDTKSARAKGVSLSETAAFCAIVGHGLPPCRMNVPFQSTSIASACAASLPLGPRPVLQAAATARILVVGQAPGLRVHQTGIPCDDPSGERLRGWMGVSQEVFYDASRIAIIPMGYCYPGRGTGGDLPPAS